MQENDQTQNLNQNEQNKEKNTATEKSIVQEEEKPTQQNTQEVDHQHQEKQRDQDDEKQTNSKASKTGKVQITKKQLKKYLKFATENENIKKEYNRIAKESIALNQELQKTRQSQRLLNDQNLRVKQMYKKSEKELEQIQTQLKSEKQISQKRLGLEETIKELQKIVDVSTQNEQSHKREADKYKEMLRLQTEMNEELKKEVEDLRNISSEYFLLKQEVSRLKNQLLSLRVAKQQYPILLQKYQLCEQINQKLKETIRELEQRENAQKQLTEKAQKKLDKALEDKKAQQRKNATIKAQKQELEGELEALKLQYEDQQSEIEVQRKRYLGEIKDFKLALHHDHEKLKILQIQLAESKKREKKPTKLDSVRFSDLSKEDLFNVIEELEMKNGSIKINLECLAEEIIEKDKKIQQQAAAIVSLSRELIKALPNLEESEGMEYIEKEIIEVGKSKKSDWGDIVEKVMLENLRLKNSVTTLGQQYNMRLRKGE